MKSFQRKSTGMFIGGACLAVAACMAGSGDANVNATVEPALVKVMQGRKTVSQLYAENCANCHGQNGEGGGGCTRTLITREKFDQSLDRPFFDAIKDGVADTPMPSYKESLTDCLSVLARSCTNATGRSPLMNLIDQCWIAVVAFEPSYRSVPQPHHFAKDMRNSCVKLHLGATATEIVYEADHSFFAINKGRHVFRQERGVCAER